jgi:hypothetical protein
MPPRMQSWSRQAGRTRSVSPPVVGHFRVLFPAAQRPTLLLFKRLAVLGRNLTVGKSAEAISLDYQRHRRAWTTVWLT